MLSIVVSIIFSGSAVCISKVAPEMQFGAKPTKAFAHNLPANLNSLDLGGSELKWDPVFLMGKSEVESRESDCGCGGAGCPFCRGPSLLQVSKADP